MPAALGFFSLTFPALRRWAFLFRPAGRDWGRVAQMGRVCRARGTRILFPHFPSAEALGFPISSRRAGLGSLRLVSLCHRTRRVERLSQRTCRTERPGRSIGKPTASAVGKRSSTAGVPRGRHMPHRRNPQRTPRHHRRHRATPRSFFRDNAGVLAESAKPLRNSYRAAKVGQIDQDPANSPRRPTRASLT